MTTRNQLSTTCIDECFNSWIKVTLSVGVQTHSLNLTIIPKGSSILIIFFPLHHIIGGIFGAFFNAINHHLSIFRVRFIKNRPMRVIESLLVATMSSCVAFSLIYFHNDCQPVGVYNTTATLQVSLLFFVTKQLVNKQSAWKICCKPIQIELVSYE